MRKIVLLQCLILFMSLSTACGQDKNERTVLGKSTAEKELELALSERPQHNVISQSTIIKDNSTAIKVAEPILFSVYGEDNIINQRPYEVHLIEHYWVISGTLPEGMLGGTFLIIIDSRNSEILKLTHGK